jgi:hypothetical protein
MLAVVFAKIKELAPYAAIELVLPGGSLMALTLWFYRRRKRVPALARSLNALLKLRGQVVSRSNRPNDRARLHGLG